MSIAYRKVKGENVDTVVAFFPHEVEPVKEADSKHPHWSAIVQGLEDGDDSVYELFDVGRGLRARLQKLSERIDYDGKEILFDGDVVDDALSQQIIRFLEQGQSDYEPLVKFWEKISTNPSEHSRDNLYRWLRAEGFSITANGDIVGYKGVSVRSAADGSAEYRSIHAGPAVVDGVAINGNVPNQPGSVITMARSDVTADPSIGCHIGLHVGTWDYAKSFGSVVLEVHVNPRDVVSVPTDCSDAKMRCSKYVVVQQIGAKYDDVVVYPVEDYTDEEEYAGDVGYKGW